MIPLAKETVCEYNAEATMKYYDGKGAIVPSSSRTPRIYSLT